MNENEYTVKVQIRDCFGTFQHNIITVKFVGLYYYTYLFFKSAFMKKKTCSAVVHSAHI